MFSIAFHDLILHIQMSYSYTTGTVYGHHQPLRRLHQTSGLRTTPSHQTRSSKHRSAPAPTDDLLLSVTRSNCSIPFSVTFIGTLTMIHSSAGAASLQALAHHSEVASLSDLMLMVIRLEVHYLVLAWGSGPCSTICREMISSLVRIGECIAALRPPLGRMDDGFHRAR